MHKRLIYLKLQLKSAFLCIPKLLAGTLLFSCLAVLIGYAGSKTLYHNDSLFYFRIAAVLPENDALVNIGFNIKTKIAENRDRCIPDSANIWLFPLFLAKREISLSTFGVIPRISIILKSLLIFDEIKLIKRLLVRFRLLLFTSL